MNTYIKTKKALFAVAMFLVFLILFSPSSSLNAQETKAFKIGLAVLKDNPDYANGRAAFVKMIQEAGLNCNFELLNAFGDSEVYREGLNEFIDKDKVDLIFTTGTVSTLPAVELVKEIPVVFTAVASPVRSGIVESLEKPGGNVTGTHCGVEATPQIKTIMKVLPTVKKLGIVYTKGESNAEIQTQDFIDCARRFGLEVLTSTVTKGCETESEVSEATKKLTGKVDVLIAHQDTSLSKYGKGMIEVAEENKIPTYVSLGHLLEQGAMFSLGIDFRSLGKISGTQAVKILKEGIKPEDLPVETDKHYELVINLKAAKKIGLELPIQVLRSASKIIK